jgi:hypothetical protein
VGKGKREEVDQYQFLLLEGRYRSAEEYDRPNSKLYSRHSRTLSPACGFALPNQWEKLMALHSRKPTDLKISARDIRCALKTLLESTEFCRDYCLCFFIDGLDEYEEILGEEYEDLATMLLTWTDDAPDNVKLCVSSRELSIFQNTFSPKQRLRLQELTKNDIEAVIRDRLSRFKLADEAVDGENLKEKLISEIIRKPRACSYG